MSTSERFDLVVIGSGPAGQKAAIQAAKAGRTVALVEREAFVGGACVRRGTIPSKTLRDSALHTTIDWAGDGDRIAADVEVGSLTGRLDQVVRAHAVYMERQIQRNGIQWIQGKVRFTSPERVEIQFRDGKRRSLCAEFFVIATGSRPRAPSDIPVDHENILDSDSILSMIYLPRSLTVLGGGVIASEYASIFARLGVQVTMIDSSPRPLRFVDEEIVERFVAGFAMHGGRYIGGQRIESVRWDGLASARTRLANGTEIASEKMLVALGRVANVEDLGLEAAGLQLNDRGVMAVDENCRTARPNIYAVGDVIGPPALAATSMEQGRRAVCHALGLEPGHPPELSPIGIYTIPEIATVGLSEGDATKRYGSVLIGRSRFDEVARGQIGGITDGLLKLVSDPSGRKLLGAQIVGEGATELIHVAQLAILSGLEVDAFIENIFNFPTLAEAYRVAAFDVARQRPTTRAGLCSAPGRAA
ncbi:MAG: Si-specific NAD(P)(+) transhydrogenase [Deltaproteobacteria bacterium]|nr:Si-specific NAD(P)(+) transhydrogenase [Deltaproteobacteria bacterium]